MRPPWAGFHFVHDVVPAVEDHPFHLTNLGVAELLYRARNAYVAESVGLSWQELFDSGRIFAMRRLEIDYERQVAPGRALKVGVRAVMRSRRTIIFDEVAWEAEPAIAFAVAKSVHLVVRTDDGTALDLPDDVLSRFEAFEGHSLPGRSQ